MGLVASVGKNNDELVDNLVKHDSIKNERVERIMRLVDRGKFMPENAVEENAYKDSAWKSDLGLPGFLHISAPCIYANVLEHLDLQKGQSFLNIGSGTGYLSTMAGFFLEENGINHGVELYENVADYAAERISLFQSSPEACAFEWCSPTYFVGNAFQLEQNTNKYDRIYCGALVPESHRAYFCSFLKEEGILVMPYGHSLQRVIRKSEKLFKTRDLSAVTFSHLIPVNIDDNSLSNGSVSLPLIQPTSLQFLCRNKIRQLIRQKLLVDKPVEIFSLYAKKHAKKASSSDERNQRNPSRDNLFPPRPMVLNPHLPQLLPLRTRFTSVGTNTNGDPNNNNNRAANNNNNGRHNHNNNHRQMLANLRHTHATQFRHLFALFARDRIRRHHEAIAHHHAARRNVLIINNANDSDNDEENDDDENEQLEIELRDNERQQRFYSGPDDEAFNFVFESEDEVNNEDDDEHEEEEEGEEEEEENVENDDDSIGNYENVDRTDNEDDEKNEAVNSDDADSWSDRNNVGSLSSSESYGNLNNDKNDDSYKTAKMTPTTTTTPKKKAKTKSKKCKNKLARLGLELSSDNEEEEEKENGEEKEEEEGKEDVEEDDGQGEKEKEGEKEDDEGEKNEEDGDNSNESFETAKDIIMIKDKNFEAFERYASKMSKNSDDKDGEDKIGEELNKEDGWEESSRGYRFPHSEDEEEDKIKEGKIEEDDGWEETYRRYCLSKMSDDEDEEDKIEEDDGRKEDYRRYCLSKMCKNSGNEKNKIEEEERDDNDDEMENDEEKVEEDKEKLNDSMNSSPLKNGSCNNKRLRTCTSNSLEMPQSSKMKRVLSYIEEQAQEEGEHGGVAGPSTSWPTQYLHQRPAPYLHKKQTPISNNTTREEEENVAEAKFNETKVKERTEQLADFHAKFIELIQSLPLNIQMRKFLVYENA